MVISLSSTATTFYSLSFSLSHVDLGAICGGLTASVTLGFVHGLFKGRKFHDLKSIASKSRMLSKAYTSSVVAALGMALCANQWLRRIIFPSEYLLAIVLAIMSGAIASSLSFQFYNIPLMAASTFGQNRAVCLSLLDGLGFFLSAPIWAITAKIVGSSKTHGWSMAFLMLAALFSLGGKSMMGIIPTVIKKQEQHATA